LSYPIIELVWVIGFAASTALGVVIVSFIVSYKNTEAKLARQQAEIAKWKLKVFRP
jgi:hypothetical protein